MKESSILVVSVIMKLQHRVFLGPIFSLNMKDKYFCNQCDYEATDKRNLWRHIESQHEGIRYPCNYCDYEATAPSL